MKYAEGMKRISEYRQHIAGLRDEMRRVQAAIEPEEVKDYAFATQAGEVRLSALFGDKDDLIVIHNMGRSCPYCTLWADGFNGVWEHLADRAAFVVISPDGPAEQQSFAAGRGWRFPMASHRGTSFATDMGYGSEEEGWAPGISVFQRRDGRIVRVADTALGPGDDFCAVWHMFDMLPEGAGDWQPKYEYG